jgi:ATP-dependent 26S proteasome regulatory subunit
VHLRNKPLAPGISIASLAAATEEFSGAEIQGVCTKAALRAVRRAVAIKIERPQDAAEVLIGPDDLEAELEEARRR